LDVFSQIRDMDDDEDDDGGGGEREFSKGIVWGYFEQAENTFKQMEEAMYVVLGLIARAFTDDWSLILGPNHDRPQRRALPIQIILPRPLSERLLRRPGDHQSPRIVRKDATLRKHARRGGWRIALRGRGTPTHPRVVGGLPAGLSGGDGLDEEII